MASSLAADSTARAAAAVVFGLLQVQLGTT
jgi:hypothetical protein